MSYLRVNMKNLLYKKLFFLSFVLALVVPGLALAQGGTGSTEGTLGVKVVLENPFKVGNDLYQVAEAVVRDVVMPIGGVLCVLAFIYAGFMYVTAQGNVTKIANANRMLLYAAIGTAILLGAWILASVIRTTITALTTP